MRLVEVERETTDVEEIVYRLAYPPASSQARAAIAPICSDGSGGA